LHILGKVTDVIIIRPFDVPTVTTYSPVVCFISLQDRKALGYFLPRYIGASWFKSSYSTKKKSSRQ